MATRHGAVFTPYIILIGLLTCALTGRASEDVRSDLVGRGFPGFSLPAAQGRLVEYDNEYFGQHNLVLTFFPAAFTPV
ncbi:MAG: hypothetical protein P1P84_09135 [Deferrisomatales bacterium]|nr:hypothetical protein [Deferrisomatales bacterium]